MTNAEFAAWRQRHFRSISACARALQLDRETVTALERGQTRRGGDYPVPAYVGMACAAYTVGVRDYDGGPVMIGAPLTPAGKSA